MPTIQLSLDEQKFTTKPNKDQTIAISKRVANFPKYVSFPRFIQAIGNGQSYAPGIFRDGIRRSPAWISQSVFAADIDDGNVPLRKIKALNDEFDIPVSVIHETFSSTEDKKKWRILFISEEPVNDPIIAIAILRKIQQHYKSDRSCVELARIFYSTSSLERIVYAKPNFFDDEQLDLEPYKPKPRPKVITIEPDVCATPLKMCQWDLRAFKKLNDSNLPRYSRVRDTVYMLALENIFTDDWIRQTIYKNVEDCDDFDDWDKDLDDVIDANLKWVNRQVS